MGFKCGIVGLPNVGKSTLFKALTSADIAVENYPFCTIEPNVGMVMVPDPRLDKLASLVSPKKVLPTMIEFVVNNTQLFKEYCAFIALQQNRCVLFTMN